ncbi:right-handed parallel beta-helix repeat-containing protein [Actinocorallia populi]|uniref:right-handed parallel beta-helix repeat-containing protein n=1 Tax=Actinocorallia populi TaxID=2079200 RepID=UPI0018E54380|nr:right-handed parallel beta-helix repeat-containing protein [Actinocorallia populi]
MSISLSRAAATVAALGLAVAGVTASGTAAHAAVKVKNAAQLTKALKKAKPGTTIRLAKGVYRGSFSLTRSGTKKRPIKIIASKGAVLSGPSILKGVTLRLNGVRWVLVQGLTVQGGQKGVMLDRSRNVLLDRLTVRRSGMEGVRFRAHSSGNVLRGSWIHDTGLYKPEFGEGVAIGSPQGDMKNDRSHRNRVLHNRIGPNVRAEGIDAKEHTRGGTVNGNTFDGTGMSGKDSADSWIDVKGNDYVVFNNDGIHALADGFQVHSVVKGWGCGNVFKANLINLTGAPGVNGTAYGVNAPDHSADCATEVASDNTVIGGTAPTNPGLPFG